MARNTTCSWCGQSVVDNVTIDDHTYGPPMQEVNVDDIPTLCNSCNEKVKGK